MLDFLSAIVTVLSKIVFVVPALNSRVSANVKKCKTCHINHDIDMYHGECENCAILTWNRIPKKCNFIYDEDIHRFNKNFSNGWCTNDIDFQYGMCRRCSISLYDYLSVSNLCLRKFVDRHNNYLLCLEPGTQSEGTYSMLLCNKCNTDKTFRHELYKLFQRITFATSNPVDMIGRQLSKRFMFTEMFVQRFESGHWYYEENQRQLMLNTKNDVIPVKEVHFVKPFFFKFNRRQSYWS